MSAGSPGEQVALMYEGWTAGDFDQALDACAEDIDVVDPVGRVHGRQRFRHYLATFKYAMPDGRVIIEHAVEAGDTVAVEGRFTGTHTRPLAIDSNNVQPTGRAVNLRFADIIRLRDRKIVSYHTYWDMLQLLTQLGVMHL